MSKQSDHNTAQKQTSVYKTDMNRLGALHQRYDAGILSNAQWQEYTALCDKYQV